MERLTIEQIEAIRERAEKATQGATPEWYVDEGWKDTARCSWSGDLIAQSIPTEADAEFIANARQDIPALLAEVDRLRREISFIAHVDMTTNAYDIEHLSVSVKSWAQNVLEGVNHDD